MKITRIVKLMNYTEGTLNEVLRDYGHVPMTQERAEIVAGVFDLLDLVKEVKIEMREGMEGRLKTLRNAIEALD